MFQRTKLAAAVLAAFSIAPQLAAAQDVQRVEITGSAIRRVDAESALPVQVLKREQIEATGATSVVDLLQRLSVNQGATTESLAVGSSTFGFSGISIHNVGETRTLVLLNGHRLSQFGGQTLTGFAAGFDLNAVPISAIERVEILSDGASALYGADAVAGVVNFITKRDSTYGDVSIGYSAPQGGAKEVRISATKGFGSLEQDGFNVVLTAAHDERTKLDATERDYAKTGNIIYRKGGKTYRSQNYSASSIPGNVVTDDGLLVNTYLIANGACPESTFRVTDADGNDFCGFDYVSTLEIFPERKRDSLMVGSTFQLGEHRLTADVLYSSTQQISRIAPVPGGITIEAGTPLHDQYLAPIGITQDTVAFYRVAGLGKRTSDDRAEFYDVALGASGPAFGWDYNADLSYSQSTVKSYSKGYPGARALSGLIASGVLNPFVLASEQSDAEKAALAAINYDGYFDGGVASLTSASLRGSRAVGSLGGGDIMLALGASVNQETIETRPSLFAQQRLADPVTGELCGNGVPCDVRFGDAAKAVPFSSDRVASGLFAEMEFPFSKALSVTGAVRHDQYSDFGGATTAKASFRFTPTRETLIRGSVGTGFKAPSVSQVDATLQKYGVTAGRFSCSPEMAAIAAELGAVCRPGSQQYDIMAEGNPDLKPERSQQATVGFRIDAAKQFSFGADWWWVRVKNTIGQYSATDVFGDPLGFRDSWTTYTESTGVTYLAFYNPNRNLGDEYRSGIDFDVTGRFDTPVGKLTSQLNATWMLRHQIENQIAGGYDSSLGKKDAEVVFRWQGTWLNSLKMGDWTHTLATNFKSGYKDLPAEDLEVLDADGNVTGYETVELTIKPHFTFDWQSRWDINKSFTASLGVLNLFDEKPPFTFNGYGGQQVGYDAQYYDSRGRTVYVDLTYKF